MLTFENTFGIHNHSIGAIVAMVKYNMVLLYIYFIDK